MRPSMVRQLTGDGIGSTWGLIPARHLERWRHSDSVAGVDCQDW